MAFPVGVIPVVVPPKRWWVIAKTHKSQGCGTIHPDSAAAYLRREGYDILQCDGRTYDPAVYRELGAWIGDTYGVDEASGLPRLPDLRKEERHWRTLAIPR